MAFPLIPIFVSTETKAPGWELREEGTRIIKEGQVLFAVLFLELASPRPPPSC
jgi:hypothetical protein